MLLFLKISVLAVYAIVIVVAVVVNELRKRLSLLEMTIVIALNNPRDCKLCTS